MDILKKNQLFTVTISGYTAQGLGVARVDGQVVFVHGGVRDEICVIRILKVQKHFAFARVEKILQDNGCRQNPDCPHYPACGGCDYRHVTYAEELTAKRQLVQDALQRIGKLELPVEDILGAPYIDAYRNKTQFPVSSTGHIGFYRARTHEVVPALDCRLQTPQANAVANAVQTYLREYQVPAYDEVNGSGLLRHLYIRTNHQGQALVCLVVNGNALPHETTLVHHIRALCPDTLGVVLCRNVQHTNVVLGDSFRTLWGTNLLEDVLCGLTFQLSIPSFYQVNRLQAERLYDKVVEFAGLTGRETVLDLYCGIGTISLVLARKAAQVTGIEIVPDAVRDAEINARKNGIHNACFWCGDAAQAAVHLSRHPHVLVVDPPRKGLPIETVNAMAAMKAERIVYVSCDPASLARDVERFQNLGYQALRCIAVDMFPRTRHVETIVLLSHKKE